MMVSEPLTFEFLPDPSESVRVSRYIQRRQRFGWLSWAISPMLLLLAVLHWVGGGELRELQLVGLLALVFGSMQLLGPWLQRRQFRRAYAETPSLRVPQVYRFAENGIHIAGGASITTLGWPAIVEADETDESFLLFFNKRCAYYLPKRVVGGPQSEDQVRAILQRNLGARAVRLGR